MKEMENDDERRAQASVRCAKSIMALRSLETSPILHTEATSVNIEHQVIGEMKREIADLKTELATYISQINLCSSMELALQVAIVLLVSTFFLFIAFEY